MPIWESFANQYIKENKDKLQAMPVQQRVAEINAVGSQFEANPYFQIDESRIKPETISLLKKSDAARQGFEPGGVSAMAGEDYKKYKRQAELEAQGVDLDQEIPFSDSWKLGFGVDPLNDLKDRLKDHYKTDIKITKDGDDYIYLNPETKKLTKANLGAIASAGQGLPLAGDVAGTVGLAAVTKGRSVAGQVAGETVGSGIGATIGEGARLLVGKWLGIHDLDYDEIAKRAGKEGATAAAFTGGVGTTVASAKAAYNFIKGGQFSIDEAAKYGLNVDEANEILAGVNKVLKEGGSDKKVRATLAKKTGDVDLGGMEAEIATSKEHGARFVGRERSDQAGLSEAVDIVTKPKDTAFTGSQTVSDVASQQVSKRVEQAKQIVSQNRGELDAQLKSIGKVWKEEVGEPTAKLLAEKKELSKGATDLVWNRAKKVGGYDAEKELYNIDIPQGEGIKKLKSLYERRSKSAQTRIEAGGINAIFAGEKKAGQKAVQAIDTGNPVLDRIRNRRAQQADLPDSAKTQDLADLNDEISILKKEWSDASKGKNRNANYARELGDVVEAMVEDRNKALVKAGRTDLIEAIADAEAASLKHHETYTRSVVGDLLEKTPSGTTVIKSKKFVDNVLGRNADEIQDFKNVISDDMELTQQWKEGIADSWKQTAFNEDGKYSASASKKWVKSNLPALKEFFSTEEVSKLMKTGKLAELVYGGKVTSGGIKRGDMISRLQKFKNNAETKFGRGKLSRADNEGLVEFITGGKSWVTPAGRGVEEPVSKIKFVKNMTAENPAAWQKLQNSFKQSIRDDIINTNTGLIDQAKIADWTTDTRKMQIVKEMMGSKYLDDLKTIGNAVKIVNRPHKRLTGGLAEKAVIQGIRATAAPPLSPAGRILTGGLTLKTKMSHRLTADSLLSETRMRKVAELLRHNPKSRIFAEKAASLGYAIQDDNEE